MKIKGVYLLLGLLVAFLVTVDSSRTVNVESKEIVLGVHDDLSMEVQAVSQIEVFNEVGEMNCRYSNSSNHELAIDEPELLRSRKRKIKAKGIFASQIINENEDQERRKFNYVQLIHGNNYV